MGKDPSSGEPTVAARRAAERVQLSRRRKQKKLPRRGLLLTLAAAPMKPVQWRGLRSPSRSCQRRFRKKQTANARAQGHPASKTFWAKPPRRAHANVSLPAVSCPLLVLLLTGFKSNLALSLSLSRARSCDSGSWAPRPPHSDPPDKEGWHRVSLANAKRFWQSWGWEKALAQASSQRQRGGQRKTPKAKRLPRRGLHLALAAAPMEPVQWRGLRSPSRSCQRRFRSKEATDV